MTTVKRQSNDQTWVHQKVELWLGVPIPLHLQTQSQQNNTNSLSKVQSLSKVTQFRPQFLVTEVQ